MIEQLPDRIFETVGSILHQIRVRHHRAFHNGESGISGMEYKALKFLSEHPGATQKDLVQRSGRDKGQIARIIAKLKQAGLVVAEANPNDKRASRLQLTDSGNEMAQGFRLLDADIAREAVSDLTKEEQQQLESLLARVLGRLSD